MSEEYQGWTNSRTWNVNWLIDQDKRANDMLAAIRKTRQVNIADMHNAFQIVPANPEKWVTGKTNWQEIVDFWNDKEYNEQEY